MASTQRPDRNTRHRRLEAFARAGETWRGSQGLLSLLAHRAAGIARPCPGTRCRGSLRRSDPRPDGSTRHRGSSTRRGVFEARAACGQFCQRSAGFGQVAGPSTRRCQGASPSATRPPSLRLRAGGSLVEREGLPRGRAAASRARIARRRRESRSEREHRVESSGHRDASPLCHSPDQGLSNSADFRNLSAVCLPF